MKTESAGSIKPVAVIILGADALLAARPSTPIQLWHACLAAGYDLAVPATWGDELIAAEALRAAGSHPETVAVMCSCPMVARAIADGDAELSPHLISLVAPPVATARYLRRVYGERRVHITFAGTCPSAADSAIDAWLTPPELLERFSVNAIDLARQPQLFDSILPPDRRRHLSQPGGLPAAERASVLPRARQVVELDDPDVLGSLRRHLMGSVRALVDVAPRLGCACSGASPGVAAGEARLAVTLLEPPRSARPVLPDPAGLGLLRRVPPRISTPRPATSDDVRAGDSSAPSTTSASDAADEGARPVATPRPATRSPLSWNLRERALPQPPTGGRTPIALDSVTVAAVRALEAAAKGHSSGAKTAGDPKSEPLSSSLPAPSSGLASTTDAGGPRVSDDAGSRTARATPPGGYWFVPSRSGEASEVSDAEVRAAPAVEPRTESPSDVGPLAQDEELPEASDPKSPSNSDAVEASASVSGRDEPPDSNAGATGDVGVPPIPDSTTEPITATGATSESVPAPPVIEPAPEHTAAPVDDLTSPAPNANGDSPDRGWVIAMTIILLLAGTMVIRDAVRRIAEPAIAGVPVEINGRTESAAVAGIGSVARRNRAAVSLDSLFSGPVSSATDGLPTTSRPGEARR